MLFTKLDRIAVVQRLTVIELLVALSRGVAANAPDAAGPGLVAEHMEEVVGMGTIDHEVGRRLVGCVVHRLAELAIRPDPFYPDWYLESLGFAYYTARDYERAIAAMEVAADGLCYTRAYLAVAYAQSGDPAAGRVPRTRRSW